MSKRLPDWTPVIECNVCKRKFSPGNRPDGLPNGLGFQLEDGSVFNMCADCLIGKCMEVSEKNGGN